LIEKKGVSKGSRKTSDKKVSSNSTEEVEHIIIDDSMEGGSYMIRAVRQEEEDEPGPHREIPTPVLESTPCERRGRIELRPLPVPKKEMWVQPESEKREEEEDRKSSNGKSSTSRRSPMSAVNGGSISVAG